MLKKLEDLLNLLIGAHTTQDRQAIKDKILDHLRTAAEQDVADAEKEVEAHAESLLHDAIKAFEARVAKWLK